jgi:hypothetical protein
MANVGHDGCRLSHGVRRRWLARNSHGPRRLEGVHVGWGASTADRPNRRGPQRLGYFFTLLNYNNIVGK